VSQTAHNSTYQHIGPNIGQTNAWPHTSTTCYSSVNIVAPGLSYPFQLIRLRDRHLFVIISPVSSAATHAIIAIFVIFLGSPQFCVRDLGIVRCSEWLLGYSTLFHHLPGTTTRYYRLRLRMRSDSNGYLIFFGPRYISFHCGRRNTLSLLHSLIYFLGVVPLCHITLGCFLNNLM
jgi:hypothetical protein